MIEITKIKWILPLGIGVALILLAAAGVLAYDLLTGTRETTPVSERPAIGAPAKSALAPATALAAQWEKDARLAAALAHYPEIGRQQTGVEWAFQFYSPSTQRLALIVVANGDARKVRDTLSPYAVPTFSSERWKIDSHQAFSEWWDQGGDYLVTRRPKTEVAMRLSIDKEGSDRLVWTVTGVAPEQKGTFAVTIDAINGRIVGR